MLEGHRLSRRFTSLIIMFIAMTLYSIMHLGHFVDLPYVPGMLCFRFPALFIVTGLYYLFLNTILSYKAARDLFPTKALM